MVKERRWIDLIIIPVLVGLIIAIIQFGLPNIFAEDREISYSVDDPIKYIDTQQISDVDIEVKVNGELVKSLYLYKVRIWNSGDMPIKDLPVSLIFDDIEGFKIMTITHDTIPKYEFGYINETRGNSSIRFIFSLLNPEDEDTITIVANKLACLNLYAKSEGVSIQISRDSQANMAEYEEIVPFFAAIISIFAVAFIPLSRKIQVYMYNLLSKILKFK